MVSTDAKYSGMPKISYCLPLTLTLLRGWWGRCEKTISRRRKEGRVEKKSARRTRGSNLGPAACQARVPSCTPGGLFRQASLSVLIDRVGRLRNTMCCVFWRVFVRFYSVRVNRSYRYFTCFETVDLEQTLTVQ